MIVLWEDLENIQQMIMEKDEEITMRNKITNGFYRHKEVHKYTWIQQTRKLKSIIDYIVVKQNSSIKI